MANKTDIGSLVASDMQNIIDSKDHQTYFKVASKKCCDCSNKCGSKCPCKDDDGKCKKKCEPCEKMAKKASDKCCQCSSKCDKECPCTECHDCAMCGDGMLAEAVEEMIGTLTTISQFQDELGMSKSSILTMRAADMMLAELSKRAKEDTNDASRLAELLGDEESDDPFDDEKQYQVLQSLPYKDELIESARKKLRDSDPDFGHQLLERSKERLEIPEEGLPLSDFHDRETLIKPSESPGTDPTALPPPSPTGPTEEEYIEMLKDVPPFPWAMYDSEAAKRKKETEERLNMLREENGSEETPFEGNEHPTKVSSFDKLDAWLEKQAHGPEDEDYEDESDEESEFHGDEEFSPEDEEYLENSLVEPEFTEDEEMPSLFGFKPTLKDWSDADDESDESDEDLRKFEDELFEEHDKSDYDDLEHLSNYLDDDMYDQYLNEASGEDL